MQSLTRRKSLVIATALLLLMAPPAHAGGDEAYAQGRAQYQKGDFPGALASWTSAAEAGHSGAMNAIARMYSNGKGAKQDPVEAMKWFRKSADKGNATAMSRIGSLYREGHGVGKNPMEALSWYGRAAAGENSWAMGQIGIMYESGEGVTRSSVTAMKWFQKAADAGLTWAFGSMGRLYYEGAGIPVDRAKALELYEQDLASSPGEDYSAMRVRLCLAALGREKGANEWLSACIAKQKPEGWAAAVLGYLNGQVSEKELIETVTTTKEEGVTDAERMCDAQFYIGSRKLFAGDKAAARIHFEKCLATGAKNYTEYSSARAELMLLNKK